MWAMVEDRSEWGTGLILGESGAQDRWLGVGAGLRVAASTVDH